MITIDLLRQLPAQFRARLEQEEPPDDSELMEDYELAADVAEELLRLRRWQRQAAPALIQVRDNLVLNPAQIRRAEHCGNLTEIWEASKKYSGQSEPRHEVPDEDCRLWNQILAHCGPDVTDGGAK